MVLLLLSWHVSDPDGEWSHIAIGAAIGGTANLIANWGNCDGFYEYAAAFGIGAATGAVMSLITGEDFWRSTFSGALIVYEIDGQL